MESTAILRFARVSPQKARLVADLVRGQDAGKPLEILSFLPKKTAPMIKRLIESAVANAEYRSRNENESVDVDTLYIKHAIVNEGPALRRFMPAAQGRATPIRKRTSHVEIVLDALEERPRVQRTTRKTASASTTKGRRDPRARPVGRQQAGRAASIATIQPRTLL